MFLLSIILMQPMEPIALPKDHEVNHCYSDDGEFTPRIIKILKVGEKEYLYEIKSNHGWFGTLNQTKAVINDVYWKEVDCEKK